MIDYAYLLANYVIIPVLVLYVTSTLQHHGCCTVWALQADLASKLLSSVYCSTNNKANTVLELFRWATTLFGVPSRVRSDHGGESMGVCEFMIMHRGVDRASHIAGSSVYNAHVEGCISLCLLIEESEYIDPGNNCYLYALQVIYTLRINQCLRVFACGWNHHPLRTEHHWSPKKIWMNGCPDNRHLTAVRDVIDPLPADATGSLWSSAP